jgi:hypothetical protein
MLNARRGTHLAKGSIHAVGQRRTIEFVVVDLSGAERAAGLGSLDLSRTHRPTLSRAIYLSYEEIA